MTAPTADRIREAPRVGDVGPDALPIDTPSLGALLEQCARERPDALPARKRSLSIRR